MAVEMAGTLTALHTKAVSHSWCDTDLEGGHVLVPALKAIN